MARTPKDITDAELALLELLWQRGPSTVRELAAELYPGGGGSELATVQKLCERLDEKRFVRRDRSERPQRFAAAVERSDLIGRQLRSVADRFCRGSLIPLVSHLFEDGALSPAEVRALKRHVEELDARRSRSRRKGG